MIQGKTGWKLWSLLLWWSCWAVPAVSAQEYVSDVQFFGTDAGLNSRNLLATIQDAEGFLWVHTSEGFSRFDGQTFENVLTGGDFVLRYGIMQYFFQDRDGWFWIVRGKRSVVDGTFGLTDTEVRLYSYPLDSLIAFDDYFQGDSPLRPADIFWVQQLPGQRLWITTRDGQLYEYDGDFRLLYEGPREEVFTTPLPATDSTFWVISRRRVKEITYGGRELSSDELPLVTSGVSRSPSDGSLLISTNIPVPIGAGRHTIKVFLARPGSGLQQEPADYGLDLDLYRLAWFDRGGRIWTYRPGRIEVYEKEKGKVAEYSHLLGEKINEHVLREVFFDRQNLAWVMLGEGLYRIRLIRSGFTNYLSGPEQISVRGILPFGENQLLVNSYNGSYLLNTKTGRGRSLGGLLTVARYGLARDRRGRIWVGGHSGGVIRYGAGLEAPYFYQVRMTDSVGAQLALEATLPFADQNGRLWLGANRGLFLLEEERDSFFQKSAPPGFPSLNEVTVLHFREERSGLWIATDKGLFHLDPSGEVKACYDHFPNNFLYHSYQDETGLVWLATRGGGLLCWDPVSDDIRAYTKQDGLADDILYGVFPDRAGQLWLPSNQGLMRFDPHTATVRTFTTFHGLPHDEFNHGAFYQAPDGGLYLGGLGGITFFDPGQIEPGPVLHSPLRITRCWVRDPAREGIVDRTRELLTSGRIVVEPAMASFGLAFSLLDFRNPGANRYAYNIAGLTNGWVDLSGPQLELHHPAYGRYTLRIRGMGADGLWSEDELVIPVWVQKPLYLRTWFLVMSGTLILGMTVLGIFWRIRSLKNAKLRLESEVRRRTREIEKDKVLIQRQYEELEKLNRTKDKLFSLIGHELRGPLSNFRGVAGKAAYLIRKGQYARLREVGESMDRAAVQLGVLFDNLLTWGRLQTHQLVSEPRRHLLEEIVMDVLNLYAGMAQMKEIELSTALPPELEVHADRSGLLIILNNLVSNALKFTPRGGRVSVAAAAEAGKVLLSVSDSGVGITENQLAALLSGENLRSAHGTEGETGTGLGLLMVRELTGRMGGTVTAESRPGAGTRFTIALPQPVEAGSFHAAVSEKRIFENE